MDSPLISVVIPCYNEEKYIRKCMGNLLEQSYENFEILVVDDSSTDNTRQYLREYNDSRIRIIIREDDFGITSAISRGVNESNGKYIARHDADDWSHPNRLETQVDYLESNESVALVGTGAYLVGHDGNLISQRCVKEKPDISDLIQHNEFIHGSVMMRKEALESVGGYDEWFPTTEDYDLWLRLADEYEVRNIDEPLYYFRQHDESLYGSNLEELKLYHLLAVRKVKSGLDAEIKREIDEHGVETFYDRLTTDERHWFHAELAKENLRYGNLNEGRRHARRLLSIDRTHPLAYALLALSFTTPRVTKFAARTYRRIRNWSLARRND